MSHLGATIVVVDMDGGRQEMVAWLLGADARAAAVHELRRLGLEGYDPDDLVNDVYLRIVRADLVERPGNPQGYARRVMQNQALDLLRGDRVRTRHLVAPIAPDDEDERDPLADVADPDGLDPAVAAAAVAGEDAMRRGLHLSLGNGRTKVWAAAAALTTLTLRAHPEVALPEGVPEPDVGTTAQGDRWAALWLAGEVHVFGDGPAMRRARSRRLQEVEELLRHVAGTVFGSGVRG